MMHCNEPDLRLSVADETEKELDGALPCGDDLVRAERLRGSVFPHAECCGIEEKLP
jgi:hypothetical protein